jgi:FkbM family methyltransferase
MNPIFSNLPITRLKLVVARILFTLVRPFYGVKKRIIKRSGLVFEVDITEGLDLSLFLFGNFQKHVSENKFIKLPPDAVVFDIGANVGIMALHFAQHAPKGEVYAFEPTHYAFEKLLRNISLNTDFVSKISPVQAFITSPEKKSGTITAFSSWKINKKVGEDQHPIHGGSAMSTQGVPALTMDEFVEENRISRIDFIKIDTDGHEFDVLKGGMKTIAGAKPKIIFELGQYVMKERGIDFVDYYQFFQMLHYRLSDAATNKPITLGNYKKMIPAKGTIDVLAVPE